jgi:hypothetical protein
MSLPDHIHPIAVDEALLNIGMTINEIRALTGNPAPQIVRTPAELEALDPDTVLSPLLGTIVLYPREVRDFMEVARDCLPAVVVASGEHVRACREALEGATK